MISESDQWSTTMRSNTTGSSSKIKIGRARAWRESYREIRKYLLFINAAPVEETRNVNFPGVGASMKVITYHKWFENITSSTLQQLRLLVLFNIEPSFHESRPR